MLKRIAVIAGLLLLLPFSSIVVSLKTIPRPCSVVPRPPSFTSTRSISQRDPSLISKRSTIITPSLNIVESMQLFADTTNSDLIGEDAAVFSLKEQSADSWKTFAVAVSGVMGFVAYMWVYEWRLKLPVSSRSGGEGDCCIVGNPHGLDAPLGT